MCGIHVSITRTPSADHALSPELTRCLRARGPDHFGQVDRCLQRPRPRPEADDLDERTATSRATAWWLRFTSTVLALRGDHVARQPLLADPAGSGSVLCWNGEAWRLGGERVRGNDGEAILARLMMTAGAGPGGERVDAVLDVLRDIEGPFAFVFYDAVAGTVFFGRDRLGRQSLLLAPTSDGGLELCSIAGAADQGWQEVEADGVYVLTLGKEARPERHDWVVGDDAADFVSTSGWPWRRVHDRGRPSVRLTLRIPGLRHWQVQPGAASWPPSTHRELNLGSVTQRAAARVSKIENTRYTPAARWGCQLQYSSGHLVLWRT